MLIGYARISSVDQWLNVQIEALAAVGCAKICSEKRSGRTARDRPAPSVGDLHVLVEQINTSGAGVRCVQQDGVDTTSSTGKLMLAILGAVAEFETDIRRERQPDGIEKAKTSGVYRGGPSKIGRSDVGQLVPQLC